jgi:hypothetical protein
MSLSKSKGWHSNNSLHFLMLSVSSTQKKLLKNYQFPKINLAYAYLALQQAPQQTAEQ